MFVYKRLQINVHQTRLGKTDDVQLLIGQKIELTKFIPKKVF